VDADLLRRCSGAEARELTKAWDALLAERFLEQREPAQLQFVHSLVRDVIYGSLSENRRMWLHGRVGEALEAQSDGPAERLAYHFARAAPGDDRVFGYGLAAAQAAIGLAAWATAADHAASCLERARGPEDRVAALVVLGQARRGQGDVPAARVALEEAVALSRREGLSRQLCAATLALVGGGGRGVAVDLPDAERAALLRDALDHLTERDVDLLVPVLSELALALLLTEQRKERELLARRAIDIARAEDKHEHLASALLARRLVRLEPTDVEARLADVDEILALPDGSPTVEATMAALVAPRGLAPPRTAGRSSVGARSCL
jgi:hypothetical protein